TVRLSRNSGKYFLASGVVVSLGWVSMFEALSAGGVSVVSALIGANPLFSFALSLLLLRDTEVFSWRIAAGCLAIVAGVAVVTLL
ncbi:MAG: EamA family transporter, partial [Candidatus Bathyarchaeota archaeon]|nr:EamA family transporter [Candidatus Bathyarchaeota archaeon]